MKTRLGVLLMTSAMALAGCVGTANVGDGSDPGQSPSAGAEASEFSVSCPQWSDPVDEPEGGNLPNVALPCLGGDQQVSMSGAPTLPTLLNLWASWCEPCRAEVPVLEEFALQAEGTVAVLGVVTKDSPSNALAFAADFGMSFPSVQDPNGEIATALALPGLPHSVLIDSDGAVVGVHVGAFSSVDQIAALVQEKLGVTI